MQRAAPVLRLVVTTVSPMAVRGIRVPLATRVPLQPIPASHALPYAFPRRFLSSSDKSSSSEQGSPTTDPADGGEDLGKGTETAIADKLQSELKKVEEELQDMKDKMLRAFADAENARVIARKDVESARTYAITKFAKGMLEVADNLSRAIESVPREQQPQTEENKQLLALLQGVELTNAQLEKVFGENGLLKFGNVGDKFDPLLHDALFEFADPNKEPGTIGKLMKAGYKLNDRVIRPAQVGTVRKAEN